MTSLQAMLRHISTLFVVALVGLAGCGDAGTDAPETRSPERLHDAMRALTDVMIHDIFSPAQSSRIYAYTSIAAYEATVPGNPIYHSLAGQLNGLEPVPTPDTTQAIHYPLASVHAFLTVAGDMIYSVDRLRAYHDETLARFREAGVTGRRYEASLAFGEQVAQHVAAWRDADGYNVARSATQFTVTDEPGRWRPTPPAYMDGVDPNWNMVRPFVLDSASQFKPAPPLPFSTEDGSPFFREVREVYEVAATLTDEQREIAAFWDCNPYVMHTRGHAMFATKQITPGGHWMGITAIANRQSGGDYMDAVASYAAVAVAVADGFISAFDEKYRSALIRPETVINQHIDEAWQPILQTPPFPEYTSAHSVISSAAATMLTDRYGPDFAFDDTSEVAYGLPVRSFNSFHEAAREAGISRLYGGIHYRRAIEVGLEQGLSVGELARRRLDLRDTATEPAIASTN